MTPGGSLRLPQELREMSDAKGAPMLDIQQWEEFENYSAWAHQGRQAASVMSRRNVECI